MFKDTTSKSNLLVFIFFLIMLTIAITFSGCDNSEPNQIIIRSKIDVDSVSSNGTNLYDSVYFNNLKYIDTLKTNIN